MKAKNSDSFRNSIRNFIQYAESKETMAEYVISQMCSEFGFQKRRLYDVINVLEPVGICKKTSVDTIQWNGLHKVPQYLIRLQKKYRLNSPSTTLGDIFSLSDDKCISISHLTVSFVLMFFALKQRSLEIKHIGAFLSKTNGRYKTTLCKLYQIAHILEAASIIEKSIVPGELTIAQEFYTPVNINEKSIWKQNSIDPLRIESLLNRPSKDQEITAKRRDEFLNVYEKFSMNLLQMEANPLARYQVFA